MRYDIYRMSMGEYAYIGSTSELARRASTHRYAMKAGTHKNKHVQALYDAGVRPVFTILETLEDATKGEAKDKEDKYMFSVPQELSLNIQKAVQGHYADYRWARITRRQAYVDIKRAEKEVLDKFERGGLL